MTKKVAFSLVALTILLGLAGGGASHITGARAETGAITARGGGTTMVRGGTGAPSFVPVITKFAFSWHDGAGGFECLALAPSAPAGTEGSGSFETNAMYVTGQVTSATVDGNKLTLRGTAKVTGLGAGTHRHFTATATRGGPGATLVLKVSGFTFSEILIEGENQF